MYEPEVSSKEGVRQRFKQQETTMALKDQELRPKYREKFTENYDLLNRNLIIDGMLPSLFAKGVITEAEHETLFQIKIKNDKNFEFLKILPSKGEKAYLQFCQILRDVAEQAFLYECLVDDEAKEMIANMMSSPQSHQEASESTDAAFIADNLLPDCVDVEMNHFNGDDLSYVADMEGTVEQDFRTSTSDLIDNCPECQEEQRHCSSCGCVRKPLKLLVRLGRYLKTNKKCRGYLCTAFISLVLLSVAVGLVVILQPQPHGQQHHPDDPTTSSLNKELLTSLFEEPGNRLTPQELSRLQHTIDEDNSEIITALKEILDKHQLILRFEERRNTDRIFELHVLINSNTVMTETNLYKKPSHILAAKTISQFLLQLHKTYDENTSEKPPDTNGTHDRSPMVPIVIPVEVVVKTDILSALFEKETNKLTEQEVSKMQRALERGDSTITTTLKEILDKRQLILRFNEGRSKNGTFLLSVFLAEDLVMTISDRDRKPAHVAAAKIITELLIKYSSLTDSQSAKQSDKQDAVNEAVRSDHPLS